MLDIEKGNCNDQNSRHHFKYSFRLFVLNTNRENLSIELTIIPFTSFNSPPDLAFHQNADELLKTLEWNTNGQTKPKTGYMQKSSAFPTNDLHYCWIT